MTEQNQESTKDLQSLPPLGVNEGQLDVAGKSLSEALRISFVILKIIMIVLVIVFLASGFRTVGSDEQAVVLRFGRIYGVGEQRVLTPGLHWVFPYPIDEIVKIPVEKKVNLAVNSFWYHQTKAELLDKGPKGSPWIEPKLSPVIDGYCITRSEKHNPKEAGFTESDYNIVHTKWQLTYKIDDPERFFRNVYVEDIKPGEIYFDVVKESLTPLLKAVVEDAVVTAIVNYSIDEVISSRAKIPQHVKRLLQDKFSEIDSGIKVVSVQLTDVTWPRQVNDAFWASFKASQEKQKVISEAKGYAENTLNEAAGPVALELLDILQDETAADQQAEALWSQLAGAAQEKIANAKAYRTNVVESARANADYLQKILPEYRKRPELVIQKIYQDAIEFVLDNADEKMIIHPSADAKGRELRILLNRDPAIKPKSESQQEQ